MEYKDAKKYFEKSILAIGKEYNLAVSKLDISYNLDLFGQDSISCFTYITKHRTDSWLNGFSPRISHYYLTNALRVLQKKHPVFSKYNNNETVVMPLFHMYPTKIKKYDNTTIRSLVELDSALNELRYCIELSKTTLQATNTWDRFITTMRKYTPRELYFIVQHANSINNPFVFIIYKLLGIDANLHKEEYFTSTSYHPSKIVNLREYLAILEDTSIDELMNVPFDKLIPLNSNTTIPNPEMNEISYTSFNDEIESLYIIEDPTLQNMDALMNTLKRNFGDLGPFLGEEDIFSAVNDDKIFAIGHKDGVTFVTMPVNDSEDVLNMYEGRMWYDALIRSECKGQVLSWHQYKVENQILKYSNRSNTIVQQDKNDIDIMVWRDDNTFKDDFKFLFLNGEPSIFKKVGELPFENKDANMSYYCQKLLCYYLQKITGSSSFTDTFFQNIKLNVINSNVIKI